MSRTTQAILDMAVLSMALWLAFFVRFDGHPPFLMLKRLVFVWPWVVGLQFGVLSLFGIPRFSWRFIGLREVTRILLAVGLSSVILLAIRVASARLFHVSGYFQYLLIPIGVIAMDSTIALLGIAGVRALRRITSEKRESRQRGAGVVQQENTILIGAGAAGLLIAKELSSRPELGMRPVGFLDDDERKVGTVVHGVQVLGTTLKMQEVAEAQGATLALIAIASARGNDIRRLSQQCRNLGIRTKIIPSVHDIVSGHVKIGEIRELAIEDLLRRDPVQLEEDTISDFIQGQVVVVTGAGGSIGSELCLQICRFDPKSLVMIERSENALFEAHRMLLAMFPDVELVPSIADVSDVDRIRSIFEEHQPHTVFHAAAHKHVPMMESNPGEAVKNNILGTKILADIAHESGVDAFVMVSTDKAVNPTSVMGATKRIAEQYIRARSSESKTRFVTVRFGNVLGSAGSVIPIFKKQIAEGGPVTVTHPDMTRYFMTIPEACQLILQAGTMGVGGEIFILDMGEPVNILDLARDLISLSGLVPDEQIEIVFSGVRPGEKLFEELSLDAENAENTRHPKIFVGKHAQSSLPSLNAELTNLTRVTDKDPHHIRTALSALVPEYAVPTKPDEKATDRSTGSITSSPVLIASREALL